MGSGQLCFSSTGAQRIGTPRQTDLGGLARFEATWATPPILQSWSAGTTWTIQAILRDHQDPARANTSNALRTEFY